MLYNGDNKQIKNEIKKLIIDENITFTEISEKMNLRWGRNRGIT